MAQIPYTLIRSKRKSLAIIIDADANVVVRAPLRAKADAIERFVREKEAWIRDKQADMAAIGARYSAIKIENGARVPYLGQSYALAPGEAPGITVNGDALAVPAGTSTHDLAAWYRERAREIIFPRAERYARAMGVTYTSLKLSEARGRWGSCGPTDSINLAWRLVMCPPRVIDYVVVHELCHIPHKNHGAAFWAAVAAVIPDYRTDKEWLSANRKLMQII